MTASNTYTTEEVEALLALRLDPHSHWGLSVENAPDADMPKGSVSKAKQGGWIAELIDAGRAWDHAKRNASTLDIRRAYMRYGLGYEYAEIALAEGVGWQRVQRSCLRAIDLMTRFLNGEKGE